MQAAHVCVELADEAAEVIVLEVLGQLFSGKLSRVPHHEGFSLIAPGDDDIVLSIGHQFVPGPACR